MSTNLSNPLTHTKTDDLIPVKEQDLKVDLSTFVGSWKNTKEDSGQIVKAELSSRDQQLILQAYGACEPDLCDWGTTECTVFTDAVNSPTAIAFFAKYEFNDITVEISSNVKLGVLVIQTYTTFNDGSGRQNYYTREFYHRQ